MRNNTHENITQSGLRSRRLRRCGSQAIHNGNVLKKGKQSALVQKSDTNDTGSNSRNHNGASPEGKVALQDSRHSLLNSSNLKSTIPSSPFAALKSNASASDTNESKEIENLILSTVTRGESNSCLVIGTKFFETHFLVENIIQNISFQQEFFVVKLDGSVHTDDRIALLEVARQLRVKVSLPDDASKLTFADSLATLLGTLHHSNPAVQHHGSMKAMYLLNTPIVFLLRDVDCFAQLPRQTLLYNILDIAQTQATPMAVVATSGRLDCAELFEKRVKSRFSNRLIYVSGVEHNSRPTFVLNTDSSKGVGGEYPRKYGRDLMPNSSDHHWLKNHRPARKDNEANRFLFANSSTCSVIENPLYLLESLSELEMSLLCCAARLEAKDNDFMNFDMCFAEYSNLVSVGRVAASVFGASATTFTKQRKSVLAGAWANLVNLGLLSSKSVDSVSSRQKWMSCQVTLHELRRTNTQPALQKWLQI